MPFFLWMYFGGLAVALVVGVVAYATLGGSVRDAAASLVAEKASPGWATLFSRMLVLTAVTGGLSVSWYGCGYTDYSSVANSPTLAMSYASLQVAGALREVGMFLVGCLSLGGLTYALQRRGSEREPGEEKQRPKARRGTGL